MAKAVIVIYLSFWLYRRKDTLNNLQLGYIPLVIILGVTFAMIFLQPDLSAAVTILMLGVMLFFLAGGDWKVILLVFVLALLVGVPLMYLYPTGRERLSSYLTGLNNPLQSSYHIQRTLELSSKAAGSGLGSDRPTPSSPGCPWPPQTASSPLWRKKPASWAGCSWQECSFC